MTIGIGCNVVKGTGGSVVVLLTYKAQPAM